MILNNNPFIDAKELEARIENIKMDNIGSQEMFLFNVRKKNPEQTELLYQMREMLQELIFWQDITINKFSYKQHGKLGEKIRQFGFFFLAKLAGPILGSQVKFNVYTSKLVDTMYKFIELQSNELEKLREEIKNQSK